jgi:tRNA 2-selenouridine synthase
MTADDNHAFKPLPLTTQPQTALPTIAITDALFIDNTVMLDVRAPVEFDQGSFPHTVNVPLMTDVERHQVGICYKQSGQAAAIALGHQLVCGEVKALRMQQWLAFAQQNPHGVLYCFRGGLRSQTVQQWLAEAGVMVPRIEGGYKAMRQYLLNALVQKVEASEFLMVGGMTGTGKTDVINVLPNQIDLEAIANHRGSSFGRHALPQPNQINFDNQLSIAFLKQHAQGYRRIVLEDESRMIGRCALPIPLRDRMLSSPIAWVHASLETRVDRIVRDYVERLSAEYISLYGNSDEAYASYCQQLLTALDNLQKKLGGERHTAMRETMQTALTKQRQGQGFSAHQEWIKPLLENYYDPMYHYQHDLKKDRIVFEGDANEVVDYCLAQGVQ